ncbi:Translation protein, beta-barrel domain [Pseudocohnilembus persalinus]|uniref:Translation protein, beta-barrel domain n=1 Tax=Pseudocohnilembus persalinus TaxID=266149 RepID=A0A0V0QNA4_PSEPJ|nr:Translation protein, beta-barrel domain [Pseudocohnilembus persalinus]|eukprot:KRX03833.1 Translation protein, beta-barrel domain [Pseudocohnilembus persalinus]
MENKIQFEKQYLIDTHTYELNTEVFKIQDDEKDEKLAKVLLKNTIFHPQGGGQPSDEGVIIKNYNKSDQIEIKVNSLVYDRGLETVIHKVLKEEIQKANLNENEQVFLKIDQEKRKLHAKIHSGGHLLDVAVGKLGFKWQPGKGYHFPKGPFVEYIGELDNSKENLEKVIRELNNQVEQIFKEINQENKSEVKVFKYDEATKIMKVPDYIPEGVDFRYVKLFKEDEGCPCGGTHVKHINEINNLEVTKIKVNKNKKTITVSYKVDQDKK